MKAVMAVLFMAIHLTAVAGQDERQRIEMPAPMVAHMLANMRDHVVALNGMHRALASRDFEGAAQIAENQLGISSLEKHGAGHMATYLPKAMQAIGTEMHRAATRFALAAQERNLDKTLTELAAVTSQCVACHRAYRIQ